MKYFKLLIAIFVITQFQNLQGQVDYNSAQYVVKKRDVKIVKEIQDPYLVSVQNLEPPFQGNSSYSYFLQELKDSIDKVFPFSQKLLPMYKAPKGNMPDTPNVLKSFEGNLYSGSVPNDNTMAINDSGIVISSINTNIIFFDTKSDSLLKTISLNVFSDTLSHASVHQYDPKVIYDYITDRFIIVNLAGASSDNTTHIVIAFQASSDVLGPWNFYTLEGNPLNDTSWTDFPAISLSQNELFVTGNLLKYGGSWQTSFKQSVIWQVDKNSGFNGDTNLVSNLFYNIKFNGTNIRNLHPVVGGNAFYGPHAYFMSNRNFDVQNDTFFLLKTTASIANNPQLEVKAIKADNSYGAPPNPRQPNSKRLATNDARVLGAFFQNNKIQFVGNTIDTASGYATIYHGIISNPSIATTASLTLFKSDTLEFGYPNISYCGRSQSEDFSLISFNYTWSSTYPGMAAVIFGKNDEYSDYKILKTGDTYMSVLLGALQRWGDYSGSQPKYNEPGKVWVSGTFGKKIGSANTYGTWIAELENTNDLSYSIEENIKDKVIKTTIFPNPSTGEPIEVQFYMTKTVFATVEILSINGELSEVIYKGVIKEGKNQITFSTSKLAPGAYLINIKGGDKIVHSSKFVKQ